MELIHQIFVRIVIHANFPGGCKFYSRLHTNEHIKCPENVNAVHVTTHYGLLFVAQMNLWPFQALPDLFRIHLLQTQSFGQKLW